MPQSKHKRLYHHHVPFTHHELLMIMNKAYFLYLDRGLSSLTKELQEKEQSMMTRVAQFLKENT